MSQTTQTAPQTVNTVKTLDQAIADNLTASTKAKGQSIVITIKGVTDWKPTANGLARKLVITDKGNFWMLATGIKNLPSSFPKPVQATAVLVQKDQYLNMVRLEFTGLETAQLLAIREIGVGRALFASAADIKLAV